VAHRSPYNVNPVPDLDHGSPVPLWSQLADRVRADITEGRITARVPSAAALAVAYGVSRDTALKALGQLRAEGLTVAHRGRGTFVRRRSDEKPDA
jgi:DNA-binding GntR family transcriptional regulator